MSFLGKYLKGWQFRTSRPVLREGEDVEVFVSQMNAEAGIARVGDTKLYVDGIDPAHLEKRVRVSVTEFDPDESVGRGEFRGVAGDSSYTM